MATINGVEVVGDKSAHDFDLLDKNDGINLANGIETNREASEDNHADIVRHRTDTDVHVTPEWKNSLVTKAILGLYWTAAQTADIINEISIAGGAKLVKVDELPETGQEQTIYLVPKTDPQAGDVFDEYVWIDNKFEFIGTTKVDLSNYATKTELNAKQDALSNQQLSNIADVPNKANDANAVHKSGNETIGGVKTFAGNIVIQGSKKVVCDADNSYLELNGGTTWGKGGSIVLSGQDRINYTNSVILATKTDTGTNILLYQNGELKPQSNNTNDGALGTSLNKWKTINGITPGDLSLPDGTNAIYVSPKYNVGEIITIPASGFLKITVTSIGDYILMINNLTEIVFSTNYSKFSIIPVTKGMELYVSASTLSSNVFMRLFPSLGNV